MVFYANLTTRTNSDYFELSSCIKDLQKCDFPGQAKLRQKTDVWLEVKYQFWLEFQKENDGPTQLYKTVIEELDELAEHSVASISKVESKTS